MRQYLRYLGKLRALTTTSIILGTIAAASSALAQGVTGSAVTGVIEGEGAGPLDGAQVQLRNTATGEGYNTVTENGGKYFIDNVSPGGPYTLTVVFGGYPQTSQKDITVSLGQRLQLDLTLHFKVEEIVILEHLDALQDHGRTGPTTTANQAVINGVPLQGRNFTDLLSTSPQATGNSIGGQNNRYNNIQIDGGANNDLFGLSSSGTPGGLSNAKPLSLEAIQEFVIQVAPFDVRQGNFTGGLVNAITKSGTNDFHGSVFTYYQNKAFTNTNFKNLAKPGEPSETDQTYTDYHTLQFGASVGGPIITDKLHFFVSADLQDKSSSFGSPSQINGDDTHDLGAAGFTSATAQQFIDILAQKYGITTAGDAKAPSINNPDRNVFAKVSWNVDDNNRLDLSYNFVSASLDNLSRTPTGVAVPGNLSGGYELSNSGYSLDNSTNTLRLKAASHWGELSNELLAGFSIVRDKRNIPNQLPLILVKVGTLVASDAWISAGGERFSQANVLDQDIYQLQDNVTYGIGDHRITVGTSNEFLKIRNLFLQAAIGAWSFNSLDDFNNGAASAFERRFGASPLQEPGTASFNVFQMGFYAQDEWTPFKNLTITPGIRMDVPFLSGANTNSALVNNAAFPLDTSKVPGGNILWSPRVGFNWDIEGTSDTIVRGGAGVFTGRPPYVWVSNAYAINGLSQVNLRCAPAMGVRPPVLDMFNPTSPNQPSDCNGGTGTPTPPTNQGEIDYFDPNTKYPQTFEAALGADKRLPWDLIGSVDFLYSHDVNGWYVTDENLKRQADSSEGRATYGTLGGTTSLTAAASRIDGTNLGQAVKTFNKSGGQIFMATGQLEKRLNKVFDVSVAYTYSNSQDLMSLTSSQALSNFRFEPIDGTIQDRNARPSAFDRTHKITLTGTADLPYGFQVGMSYVGQSGTPYAWVVNGDINADGINFNDLVYVPAKREDITLADTAASTADSQYAALNQFIDGQDCLKGARGRILQRGECRNPWQNFLNLRLAWGYKFYKDQKIVVQWDIFNVLNLINSDWGHFDSVTGFETANTQFLRAVGYDTTNNRPIYTFTAPSPTSTSKDGIVSTIYSPTQSRWRMQFGARYEF